MESSAWATLVAILLVPFFLLLQKAIHHPLRQLKLPPGPKPWPIIGNLNLMGPLPHRSIHALSQKYGPLMQLRFGSCPVVVGSSVEMAREFLKTQDLNFVSRPKTAAGKYTAYNNTGIVWSPYGPYWRQARKICWMELFSPKRLSSYEYIRVDEVRVLVQALFKSSGRPVSLRNHLANMGLNIISRMVLGKKYTDESKDLIVTSKEFKEMLDELLFLWGALNIGDSIPWLDFLDLQGYVKRMKNLNKKFDRFLEHILHEHNDTRRKEGEAFVARDMVDVFLKLADDPDIDVKLDRNDVKAITLDLMVGGTESSAVTIEWAMSELLKHPHIFEKAIEELDKVIGKDQWVEEKDMHNLPYIEAIIKETMRMHPVGPLLMPRMSREDCTIDGYDIPTGTRVLVNVWSIGRDPSSWDAPQEFHPERFIGKVIDMKGNSFELLPFGAGRRMCPGYSLGLKVIHLGLANLLHGFKWMLPSKMRPEDLNMEETFGISTPRKVPLETIVEPRLLAHLYDM